MVSLTYSVAAFATNRKTALCAVGILAGTFEFWDSGTEARVDMLFASLIGLALAAMCQSQELVRHQPIRKARRWANRLPVATLNDINERRREGFDRVIKKQPCFNQNHVLDLLSEQAI